MQPPCVEFPYRSFQKEPHEEEDCEKYDKAMGVIVEVIDIVRDGRFRGCAMPEIGFGDRPSVAVTYKTPNDDRSGAMPMANASPKLDRLFRRTQSNPETM